MDMDYKEGQPNMCNFPVCCRDNGPEMLSTEKATPAGKWGDVECDLPRPTLKVMFDYIG